MVTSLPLPLTLELIALVGEYLHDARRRLQSRSDGRIVPAEPKAPLLFLIEEMAADATELPRRAR